MVQTLFEVLKISFSMFWEVFWPLSLGFTISAIVQAVVSHKAMAKTLGCDGVKCITLAGFFGFASSSCSYAAVALARSIFLKGASFLSSMVFELASTNLVFELGIVLWVLMGWQFVAAQFVGGILMIIIIALIFRLTLTKKLINSARHNAAKGLVGKMEGHAAMDMSVTGTGSFISRILSDKGFTSISHFYVIDWLSVWTDVVLGFLIAGVLTVFVPNSFWQAFFATQNATLSFIIGPLIGPIIAIISFVCSVGNIPLAAVLWNGGISFGGVVSFIFADLIVLPILDIYRKYYGWKVMMYILVTFYIAMACAGYAVEFLFAILHIIPTERAVALVHENSFSHDTILNLIFFAISAIFVIRFLKTNGREMLQMMNTTENHEHHH